MSKRTEPAGKGPRTGAARAGRRAGSGQYEVTDRRRAIREVGRGLRQVVTRSKGTAVPSGQRVTHSRRDTVRRAAKIVVRLHRDALKELEKY